jgi:hypothetical protein
MKLKNINLSDISNIPVKMILNEVKSQGAEITQINETNIFIVKKNKKQINFIGNYNSTIPYGLGLILGSRYNVRQILKNNNISITPGKLFSYLEKDDALDFFKYLKSLVLLRLENSQLDTKSFLFIRNQHQFIQSFKELSSLQENILVEKFYSGNILRFFVTKTGFYNVLLKQQPFVVGDGLSSISNLVIKKYSNKHNINIFNPNLILSLGKKIIFTECTNITNGAIYKDITQTVNPSFLKLAFKIIDTFPPLSYLSFELITKNYQKKITKDNYIISDVYLSPGPNISFDMYQGKLLQKGVKVLANILFPNDL